MRREPPRAQDCLVLPSPKAVAVIFLVETPLGRFRRVAHGGVKFADRWTFECPGCETFAYLDDDQWQGRVSVDHAADGCPGGYHETHNYFAELVAALVPEES